MSVFDTSGERQAGEHSQGESADAWPPHSQEPAWKQGALLSKAAKQGNAMSVLRYLKDADPAYCDWHGLSPMIHAAGGGHIEILRALLARSQVKPLAMHLDIAREWAIAAGHGECADFLERAGQNL